MDYNYANFEANAYDLTAFRGPMPGTRAPDLPVLTRTGERQSIVAFEGRFLVLEMGSITCPLYQGRRAAMEAAARRHPDVSFAVLYVREAHPGAAIPAHRTLAEKQANARRLADHDHETRRVLVDDLQGSAHVAFGAYPNSVFIINQNGCVVYFSDWNNASGTEDALNLLLDGKPAASVKSYFLPVHPKVSLRVLGNGGAGSMSDFLRSLPNLVWHNLIRRNFRLWRGRPSDVPPDVRC